MTLLSFQIFPLSLKQDLIDSLKSKQEISSTRPAMDFTKSCHALKKYNTKTIPKNIVLSKSKYDLKTRY